MKKETLYPVIISIILTAAIVWGLTSLLSPPADGAARIQELEGQVDALTLENERVNEMITTAEAEIEALQAQLDAIRSRQISYKPKQGWETYFPSAESSTIIGKSVEEVEDLLGIPPFRIYSTAATVPFNREIWVFVPYDEDPTGLYLFFKGNQLWASRQDEFSGLYGSGLLDNDDFWQN
jgi:hypothetical protein